MNTSPSQSLPARTAATLLAATLLGPVCAASAFAQDGVDIGKSSVFANLIPAEQLEQEAAKQYLSLRKDASAHKALAADDHPQLKRLRAISARLLPFAERWNPRAKDWKWEINLIGNTEVNAFCMPGGKIAFYSGLIKTLEPSDDEIAIVMGHEVAHALREHARARMGKSELTNAGVNILSTVLGLGSAGNLLASAGQQLLTLKFSRSDETEADLVGMDMAARAGYDPRAGILLWQKMAKASAGGKLEFLSTHPSDESRIAEIRRNLDSVLPLYAAAKKVSLDALPAYPGVNYP
ncbi:MAG: M48 family metallopeptidase [Candidatus Protistobacter heckmanni]|nr:M48 family metallopeptidase [Candidatus Protistobacter heckmanni]